MVRHSILNFLCFFRAKRNIYKLILLFILKLRKPFRVFWLIQNLKYEIKIYEHDKRSETRFERQENFI
jgi:hypothetical protein